MQALMKIIEDTNQKKMIIIEYQPHETVTEFNQTKNKYNITENETKCYRTKS